MSFHVKVEGLTRTFKNVTALDDVTFSIRPGMIGLLGPNGAGKTTLMRILTTVLAPTAGTVNVGPYSIRRHPDEIRRLLGYLPQNFGMYHKLTARENLDYFGCLRGLTDGRKRRRRVDEVLEQVGLTAEAGRRVGGFSGGMMRRLGIAQALLTKPRLLVVDEPTAGLDPEERVRFRDLIAGFARDRIVILSTHIVIDVEDVCDQLAVLAGGRLLFSGPPERLLDRISDQVWEVQLEDEDLDELRRRHRVLTSRRRGHRILARVFSDHPPVPGAQRVHPSLEDAYLATAGRRGSNAGRGPGPLDSSSPDGGPVDSAPADAGPAEGKGPEAEGRVGGAGGRDGL